MVLHPYPCLPHPGSAPQLIPQPMFLTSRVKTGWFCEAAVITVLPPHDSQGCRNASIADETRPRPSLPHCSFPDSPSTNASYPSLCIARSAAASSADWRSSSGDAEGDCATTAAASCPADPRPSGAAANAVSAPGSHATLSSGHRTLERALTNII
jgi:hypothetical protein